MKFSQIKLANAIQLHGTQLSFIESERHKCDMELKDNYVLLTTSTESLLVPLTNVIYARLTEVKNETKTHTGKQLSTPAKS